MTINIHNYIPKMVIITGSQGQEHVSLMFLDLEHTNTYIILIHYMYQLIHIITLVNCNIDLLFKCNCDYDIKNNVGTNILY